MSLLHRSPHFVVHHERSTRAYLRLLRTSTTFATPDEARAAVQQCQAALRHIDGSRLGILFDWRQAVLSTDLQLHQALVESMEELAKRFVRRALLMATPLGKLQVTRLTQHQPGKPVIFFDENAAIAYVAEG